LRDRCPAVDHVDALLAAAPEGEILLSAAAADRIKQALPRGVSLRSLGHHRLSDLGTSGTIYQVLHPKSFRPPPSLRTLDAHPNNLPSQPNPLIGREAERRLFVRLSIFVGGATLEAAESICTSPDGEPELDVLDCITSLVDNSLLRVTEGGRESRFWMLETIRAYALEKLREDTAAQALEERHATYYLALAEEGADALHGPDQMEWLDRLEREYGDLQEALEWYLRGGGDWEALRLCSALEWFWYRYAHFSDARRWLSEALRRAAGREPPAVAAAATVSALAPASAPASALPPTPTSPDKVGCSQLRRARGRALRALGWLLMVQGEWPQARECYLDSVRIAKKSGDDKGEILALSGLGAAERWLGERRAGTVKGRDPGEHQALRRDRRSGEHDLHAGQAGIGAPVCRRSLPRSLRSGGIREPRAGSARRGGPWNPLSRACGCPIRLQHRRLREPGCGGADELRAGPRIRACLPRPK